MRLIKALLKLAGIYFGGIGIVVCVAALVMLWIMNARLQRATEGVFGKLDHSLVVVQQRIVQTQQRVAAAAITSQEIETALRGRARQEVGQRLALQLNAAEKTERLASALQQADHWLEISETSVGLAKEMLAIVPSTSAATDEKLTDQLIEEISSLRAQFAQAIDFVGKVHEHLADASEENSREERINQAVELALRVVVTLSSIDSRLGQLADRFSSAQSHVQELKTRTQQWMLTATIVITLLLGWMAAGQIALCWLAWNGLRKLRQVTTPS